MENGRKQSRSSDWHISGWRAILLVPIMLPAAIVAGLFSRPKKRTPAQVAGFIRDFLEETGGSWDWDDFTSVPLANAELEEIRREAKIIALPVTTEGHEHLKRLLVRADILKAKWLDAGQPT